MSSIRVDLAWMERGLCAQTDPEAFHPEKGCSVRDAKRTCMACDVRADCLQYALDNGEKFGVWGGLGEKERRRIKPRSKQSPVTAEEVAA